MSVKAVTSSVAFFQRFNALYDNGWLAALKPTEVLLYLAYMRHMDNDDCTSYPGSATIAKATGNASTKGVIRARGELVRRGLLTFHESRGPKKSACYVVNVPPVRNTNRCKNVTGANSGKRPVRISPSTGANFAPRTTHRTTNRSTHTQAPNGSPQSEAPSPTDAERVCDALRAGGIPQVGIDQLLARYPLDVVKRSAFTLRAMQEDGKRINNLMGWLVDTCGKGGAMSYVKASNAGAKDDEFPDPAPVTAEDREFLGWPPIEANY
jgi:hypothetical protein